MNYAESLDKFKSIPIKERPYWYINCDLLQSIPIKESGEKFVGIKNLAKKEQLPIILAPVNPDDGSEMYLRATPAIMLMKVIKEIQEKTSKKITVKVTDTYRTLKRQRNDFERIYEEIKKTEKLTGKELYNRTCEFIADPNIYPPHSTGGTIDLTLAFIENGEELNMSTPVDSVDNLSNTWHELIQGEERKNRDLLYTAMINNGFVNLATEWWHYSYGDRYWAAFLDKDAAIYASVEDSAHLLSQ